MAKKDVTTTIVEYPIIGAIKAVEQDISATERTWETQNALQRNFIDNQYALGVDEIETIPEIESIASMDYRVINKFLQERGFDISTDPIAKPFVGAASVLKLLLTWLNPGEARWLTSAVTNQYYPAVSLEGSGVSFFKDPSFINPIVALKTKTEDMVYLVMIDDQDDVSETTLSVLSKQLCANDQKESVVFNEVLFPMVNLDQTIKLDWLSGMQSQREDGTPAIIGTALQQTKFAMDEIGASVESAVLFGLECMRYSQVYEINKPFVAVVHRPSLNLPIFAGIIGEESWNKPNINR